jgi:hypothetical protein
MERKIENVEEVFARLFGTRQRRRTPESLAEVVHRTVEAARPPVDLKVTPCTWTKEDSEVLEKILFLWGTGASYALDLYAQLAKVGKKSCPPQVWKEAVDAINKILDVIEPLSDIVNKCVEWMAKLSALEMGIVRCYDAANDYAFAREVRRQLDIAQ